MHLLKSGLKIDLTTNGVLLSKYAEDLKRAGLTRVNISLDSLDPVKYKEITIRDLQKVLKDKAAQEAKLFPKAQCGISRGFNDDEIETFVNLTLEMSLMSVS